MTATFAARIVVCCATLVCGIVYVSRRREAVAIQDLRRSLFDQDYSSIAGTLRALAVARESVVVTQVLSVLTEGLESDNRFVQWKAACATGDLGREAKPVVRLLEKILRGEDEFLRVTAAEALWKACGEADKTVPVLVQALSSADRETRLLSIGALGTIGPAAKAALPPLIEMLRDQEASVRKEAGDALAQFGPEAIRPLVEVITNPTEMGDARIEGIRALGAVGGNAREVATALRELFHNESSLVRVEAAVASWRINGKVEKTVFLEAMSNANDQVKEEIIDAIAEIPPVVDCVFANICDVLRTGTPSARRVAARAIGRTATHAPAAVDALIGALKDTDGLVVLEAVQSLGGIGSTAQKATPALLSVMMHDADAGNRWRAARALGQIGCASELVVAELQRVSQSDRNDYVRQEAREALKMLKRRRSIQSTSEAGQKGVSNQ